MQPSIRGAARGRSVVTRFATLAALLTLIALALPGIAQAAPPPTITGFSPMSGPAGTTLITITGTNFIGATSVTFTPNRTVVPPGFTVNVPGTQITVTVPANAHTGPIDVTTPDGTATSVDSFVVTATSAPSITSFTPSGGAVGTVVTINGTNFDGVSAVTFGTPAVPAQSFTFVTSLRITAVVASGTTTGKISVTTPNGTNYSATDFVVATPEITSFDPLKGTWGTSVVITGSVLTGATAVKFGGTNAASFTVDSDTQITAVVANGTGTGAISVTLPSGTLTSADPFTVVHRRTTSLSLSRHLVARGQVVCDDGSVGCTQAVPVKVQRRVDGVWKTVGTGFTTSSGTYRISVTDKDGRYRAIAKKSLLSNGDICRKARSAVVLN